MDDLEGATLAIERVLSPDTSGILLLDISQPGLLSSAHASDNLRTYHALRAQVEARHLDANERTRLKAITTGMNDLALKTPAALESRR